MICGYCGFAVYEEAAAGVFKCSGCGNVSNDWGDDEDDEGDD